ncbi:hypothetical protein [uncultured Sphingomonas sp.]|uniref:hypothetical protein n=1 Tax=uncultured Sphingomonas sp. TaxID=158754 RepID=UPI00262A5991|nr:hypothetical protein [uncultured Sphingomonas sp.]
MATHSVPIRISDLPREERLTALYRRAAEERVRYESSRMAKPSLIDRLRALF